MSSVLFNYPKSAFVFALALLSAAALPAAYARTSVTASGSPPTSVAVGQSYSFTPSVSPQSTTEHWYIRNKPTWAAFDPSTGRLNGKPTTEGTYNNIRIIVTEGRASAWMAPFSITVKAASGGGGTTNSPPTISGTPATSVTEGTAYSFTPKASDANSDPLTFSVTNLPSWATFNKSTGALTGTPSSSNLGNYATITISVSDGKASASLPTFAIAVNNPTTSNGSATVSWMPPTTNSDGSALTNLAGYRINYGTSSSNLSTTVQVPTVGTTNYVVTGLTTGTWYFDVVAYTTGGATSSASNVASKTIN